MMIIKTNIDRIKNYRSDYLNSLPEFQELFIELMINNSDYYLLFFDDKEIGYVIKNYEGVLIEFYVIDKYIPQSQGLFIQVIKDLSIADIYCKSFDFLLLSNCLLNLYSYSIVGLMYRDYVESIVKKDLNIKMEKANLSKVELLLKQDCSIKELFDTETQLIDFIQNESVFTFKRNDDLIGCGLVIRTHKDWSYCDLGVWINPTHRGNSFGSQILLNLRDYAINNSLKPSCGCAIDNLASQRIIEKSGFVSKYKLINFKTK